jgi:hypothetical protein
MAWSIFSEGGGEGAAVTWAKNFLSALGVPQSNANVTFVYDWEKSEGGGGKYNPLNQGPVPGHSELTTTGQQYGGGAADYASWQAGVTGAVDYLHMQNYGGILDALKRSDYAGAKSALVASPWAASHYGGGSTFSGATPPGAAPLAGGTQATTAGLTIPGLGGISVSGVMQGIMDTFLKAIGLGSMKDMFERLGLIILGFVLVIVGIHLLAGGNAGQAINITTSSEESETGTKTSRKIKTPVGTHQASSATRTAGKGLASEAVEAAAVA